MVPVISQSLITLILISSRWICFADGIDYDLTRQLAYYGDALIAAMRGEETVLLNVLTVFGDLSGYDKTLSVIWLSLSSMQCPQPMDVVNDGRSG
jgi:uncharacterized membrane protein YpjA